MSVKVFNVSVELDIQAVTCPGVWLCPKGRIILKLFMFGNSGITSRLPPVFPLLYHQKFIFQKTFPSVRYLTDLQHILGKEFLYAELIQCSGNTGVILASFETTIFELLYPSPCVKGLIAGVDVDLLMEPTRCFPGILAPKIEVSTKTTIEEVVDTSPPYKRDPGLINPKMLSSKYTPASKRRNQRKVCDGKVQLCKCPKLRKKPLHSKRPFCKQKNNLPVVVVPNTDDSSSACTCHCQEEAVGISLMRSQSAETLQDSPMHLPIWTSASGRVYSPRSYCNIIRESTLEKDDHQTKRRKTGKDYHCKNCCSCKGDDSHSHKTCPVCCKYMTYFDKHGAIDCSPKRTKKPSKRACCSSKYTWCEVPPYTDKCYTPDEVRMAEAVHQRVSKSLDPSRHHPFIGDNDDILSSQKCPCNISELREGTCCGKSQYREEFYRDLEKFYRKLHKRAKQRACEGI